MLADAHVIDDMSLPHAERVTDAVADGALTDAAASVTGRTIVWQLDRLATSTPGWRSRPTLVHQIPATSSPR